MSHAYMSLEEFKSAYKLESHADDDRVLEILEGVSEQLDELLGRTFIPRIETRYFSGNGQKSLELPIYWDLISVTTLKEDSNNDGTYDTTWATTDYLLTPYDANPTDRRIAEPYTGLEVDRRDTGNQDYFKKGQRAYELAGEWGVCKLTLPSGTTLGAAISDTTGTSITVSDGSKVHQGHTILIDSEYLYVTGETTPGGAVKTVERGVNGSTAATHSNGADITKLVYPRTVVLATLFQASRLWTRRSSGFASQLGFNDLGGTTLPQIGVDQDYWQQVERKYKLRTAV